jgi:hypothetical protein
MVTVYNRSRYNRRHAFLSGSLAFVAGWAVVAVLAPDGVFSGVPRWRSSLWLYLGAHGIPLSDIYLGGTGFSSTQPLNTIDSSVPFRYIPLAAVIGAAVYTGSKFSSTKIKRSVSRTFDAGSAYFLAALAAMVASDIQPGVSTILLIAGVVAAAAWLGSSFLGTFTRDIPIIGVASLGTILSLGIVLVIGSAAVLTMLWQLVAISFGAAAVAGVATGAERKARKEGKRMSDEWPRAALVKHRLRENWLELGIVLLIFGLLYAGVTGVI